MAFRSGISRTAAGCFVGFAGVRLVIIIEHGAAAGRSSPASPPPAPTAPASPARAAGTSSHHRVALLAPGDAGVAFGEELLSAAGTSSHQGCGRAPELVPRDAPLAPLARRLEELSGCRSSGLGLADAPPAADEAGLESAEEAMQFSSRADTRRRISIDSMRMSVSPMPTSQLGKPRSSAARFTKASACQEV